MLFLVFYFQLILIISPCLIAGQQNGTCSMKPLNDTSFCYLEISEYVCFPVHNKTWSEYDAVYRDSIIQQQFLNNIQQRLLSQYTKNSDKLILANNPSCYDAYKKFVCQWNFPACRPQSNSSQGMCLSVCQAFYSKCLGELERCTIVLKNIDIGINQNC